MARHLILNAVIWSAVATLAIGLVDATHSVSTPEARAAAPGRAPSEDVQSIVDLSRPGPAMFAAVEGRPLFTPGRRPVRPADNPEAAGAPPVSLSGVVGVSGALIAVLRDATGETYRMRPGESVAGWRVETVDAESVRLAGAAGALVLHLDDDAAQAPGRAGSPAPRRKASGAASHVAGRIGLIDAIDTEYD